MHADMVGFKHLDVVLVFFCRFVHIEIVLEESCRGVNDAIEQLLTWCVHQYFTCHTPFGLRIVHAWMVLSLYIHAADEGSDQHPLSYSFHHIKYVSCSVYSVTSI